LARDESESEYREVTRYQPPSPGVLLFNTDLGARY
jgi:hypothetical protein